MTRSGTAPGSETCNLNDAGFAALFAAWGAGDVAAALAFFTPAAVYREAKRDPIAGHAAIGAHWSAFFRGGPPWRMTVERTFVDAAGAQGAVAYTFAMLRPDGTWDERPGCALVRLSDGLISEWREYAG